MFSPTCGVNCRDLSSAGVVRGSGIVAPPKAGDWLPAGRTGGNMVSIVILGAA